MFTNLKNSVIGNFIIKISQCERIKLSYDCSIPFLVTKNHNFFIIIDDVL